MIAVEDLGNRVGTAFVLVFMISTTTSQRWQAENRFIIRYRFTVVIDIKIVGIVVLSDWMFSHGRP